MILWLFHRSESACAAIAGPRPEQVYFLNHSAPNLPSKSFGPTITSMALLSENPSKGVVYSISGADFDSFAFSKVKDNCRCRQTGITNCGDNTLGSLNVQSFWYTNKKLCGHWLDESNWRSWCRLQKSNPRPSDYKSAALPTELSRPGKNYTAWIVLRLGARLVRRPFDRLRTTLRQAQGVLRQAQHERVIT